MADQRDPLEQQLDQLYGAPLEQFTQTRDALVRELRAAGDKDGAARIKAQRKPNLVGWALNRVRRSQPDAIDELLSSGQQLRDAQRRLLESGEHGLLRDAVARERAAVESVVGMAEAELAQAGHPAGATAQSKLWQTLHAAAGDQQTRDLLAVGRLLREAQSGDLGLGSGEPAPVPDVSPSEATPPAARRPDRAVERKRKAAQHRLEKARERHTELQQRADQSQRAVTEAQRGLDAARRDAERAHERARAAAERAQQLAAEVEKLGSAG
jgi:hypothetical protein